MAVEKIKSAGATDINIGLGANARKEVAAALTQMLADTYTLQLKTQYYHWNVTGSNFSGLHALFETQYNGLQAAVDEVAERIRAVGHTAQGTLRDFAAEASVKEDKTLPANSMEMVKNLAEANETVSREARDLLPKVQKAGDEASADLLIRRIQEHEKAAWMLRSHLG